MRRFASRRKFLQTAVFSGFARPAFRISGHTQDDCEERLLQARVRFQRSLAEERAILFKKLVSQYGAGILDTVSTHSIDEIRNSLRQADLSSRDLEAVMELLWEPSEDLLTYRVETRTETLLKLRVTGCIFAEAAREHDAADIGFAFYCAYDYGFCEGLNPEIRFTRTQTLMEGHPCCNHTYVLEKP